MAILESTIATGSAAYKASRDGMLAHTYMLGPKGESNGCVSFRDYSKFLAAFRRGGFGLSLGSIILGS